MCHHSTSTVRGDSGSSHLFDRARTSGGVVGSGQGLLFCSTAPSPARTDPDSTKVRCILRLTGQCPTGLVVYSSSFCPPRALSVVRGIRRYTVTFLPGLCDLFLSGLFHIVGAGGRVPYSRHTGSRPLDDQSLGSSGTVPTYLLPSLGWTLTLPAN